MVGDAKYRPKSDEDNRYQVISHALSMQCRSLLLIYPASDKIKMGLTRLGKVGPAQFEITLFEYGMPLDSDLELSELKWRRI